MKKKDLEVEGSYTHFTPKNKSKKEKARVARNVKAEKNYLTPEQIELGAKYLALSNICTIYHYKDTIKDLRSLERAIHAAWEEAVCGFMESGPGGYDETKETEGIDAVDLEIKSFRDDLKKGGKRAAYWVKTLRKELPFLFN